MRKLHPVLLLGIAGVVGLLAGAFLVRHTVEPLDPSRLADAPAHIAVKASASVAGKGARLQQKTSIGDVPGEISGSFIASKEAVRATYEMYTFSNIIDRLSLPRSKAYVFKPSVYTDTPLTKKANSPPKAWTNAADAADSVDEDEDDVHLWSDKPPDDDDEEQPEYWEIISYDLPLFIFWCAVLIWIEMTAMFWRGSRDLLMRTEPWRKDDTEFIAQAAKESQWMVWRPYANAVVGLGLYDCIWRGMDIFGKCFWNWDCWANLDCNLRILTPAVAECTFDVIFPAIILTLLVMLAIWAAVWACTRPYAALVCACTLLTGIVAAVTLELFTCFLWIIAAAGFNYFYFLVLPELKDCPEWYEDLGSLAFSTHPVSKEIRDGDAAQGWAKADLNMEGPSRQEAAKLHWCERFSFYCADFVQRHMRWLRALYNGWVMRGIVTLCTSRRVRVFGKEHIQHIGSHDSVLMVSNHRSYFDFFVITVMGMWPYSGANFFSMYPVRSGYFYTALCGFSINLFGSVLAMFPNIVNTTSMKQNGDKRTDGKMWNDYALRRTIQELKVPGVLVGIHPEGTRSTDADPYSMLPTKPGAGKVALACEEAHVIPIFIMGLGTTISKEVRTNFSATPWDSPIDVVFGPHVDLTDLRQSMVGASEAKQEELKTAAGERLTDAIKALAAEHKVRREEEAKAKADKGLYQAADGDLEKGKATQEVEKDK
mmetsp:Transcript_12346/g.29560  ORF Transcript_12346/g.29560 Transcript_12346/m.29560 type:complete len:710 (+) Transcript_12346:138-2267(+)